MERGFDYITSAKEHFLPKTPRAALRAVEQGLLPPAAFINRATSVKPLYEEPFNKDDIDWILSRRDIDMETLLLVVHILQKLIVSKDGETALFAAESINQIEKRYTDMVNTIRKRMGRKRSAPLLRELGETYYHLALVNNARKGIRNFYLREAFTCFRELSRTNQRKPSDYVFTINISMRLNLNGQAEKLLEEQKEVFGDSPETSMHEAENEFYRKNVFKVMRICKTCDTEKLKPEYARIAEFWRGQ